MTTRTIGERADASLGAGEAMRAMSQARAPAATGGEVIVLWVSRHEPLPAQLRVLKERLGDDCRVVVLSGAIPNAEFVMEKAREVGAKYIMPVLPLSFIARLVELAAKEGITILFSRMRLVQEAKKHDKEAVERLFMLLTEKPDARTAVEYADCFRLYEFDRFEIIRRVEVVTEPW